MKFSDQKGSWMEFQFLMLISEFFSIFLNNNVSNEFRSHHIEVEKIQESEC